MFQGAAPRCIATTCNDSSKLRGQYGCWHCGFQCASAVVDDRTALLGEFRLVSRWPRALGSGSV